MKKVFIAMFTIFLCASQVRGANLTAQGISVMDSGGSARTTFSNSETLTLRQQVKNDVTSADMIRFTFSILNPAGSVVFQHTGNAAPGTPGLSQTQISGVAIAGFYSTPGTYIFRGKATLDAETVTQETNFTISSPNITLIYPPYGARNLSDSPLILRWVGSGASRYRIIVSENAGLYNPVHEALNGGETSYSYPENTSQPRETLVPDQVYYWKVEGLDAAGNKISESNIYNFALKAQSSSQSRNVMVTELTITSPVLDYQKPINFKAKVYNSGSSSENNISVKMTLGGLSAQDSPKQIEILNSGETRDVPFTAVMPQDQDQSLAVACIDIFDDNIPDNCKTKLIAKDAASPTASYGTAKKMSYDEIWAVLKEKLGPDALKALEGYTFTGIDCPSCSGSELNEILAALASGDAQLAGATISETATSDAGSTSGAAASASSSDTGAELEAPEMDLEILKPDAGLRDEWAGYTEPMSDKEPSSFLLRGMREWKKVWSTISTEEAPVIDFGAKMVIGIVSARRDNAETIRVLAQRWTEEGLVVDYYQIQAPKGKQLPGAAYIFKVIKREEGKVKFRRLDIAR